MKRIFYIGLCMMVLAMICNDCKKEPINTEIEGHWQLLEFTTKADNEVHPCERIYYSIQLLGSGSGREARATGIDSFPRKIPVR